MKTWYFSEQSYHPAWDNPGRVRIDCPSGAVDPSTAHKLLHRYIDEWVLADELGLNIMVNEHHATYTCMAVSCMLTLGILASRTKNARLLALGVPLLNRLDPFRIAEEVAYVDCMSGGRLELGLIKGTPFEMYISNANPADAGMRYWEAHDLVQRALSSRDGPFSWEGRTFDYRHVNVIPPSFQAPHPPLWLTTLSSATAQEAGRRGLVLAITASAPAARRAYPLYREEYRKTFGREAQLDRFAFLAYLGIGHNQQVGLERAQKVLAFVEATERTDPRYINPPGLASVEDNAKVLKLGRTQSHRARFLPDGTPMSSRPTASEWVQNEAMFAGSPDDIVRQVKKFYDSCGGFGHLLIQMGGTLTHEETVDSLQLFAREVQPRLEAFGLTAQAA
jgi:alkanesulfonate monooxygenase SsuD/methylene tetrahydromethanopterin reductase-like flavin-dependent oxidoreductase (luciferase family)